MADSTRPADTSASAHQAQLDAYRRMTPEARVRIALDLSAMARRMVRDGIRARHPEYTEDQLAAETIRAWLGPELFAMAYGDRPAAGP